MHREPWLLLVNVEPSPLVLEDNAQRPDVELVAVVEVLNYAERALGFALGEYFVPACSPDVEPQGTGQLLRPKQLVRARLRVEILCEQLPEPFGRVLGLAAHLRIEVASSASAEFLAKLYFHDVHPERAWLSEAHQE